MIRSNPVKVVLILLFFLGVCVFSQDKQANDDKEKKLREEILAVYQSKGEQGLRDFVKNKKDEISNKFIVDFAKAGVKARKEEWLKICESMAEEKKDEKTLADVLFHTGRYFRLTSNHKKSDDYFDKALPIYLKLKDLVSQGNVYLVRGNTFLTIGKNSKALEMYDKALSFYKDAGNTLSLGNVYRNKGVFYFYTGERSKALEMYDKALPFYEKADTPLGQGNVYDSKGDIYFYTGDNSRALEMYDKALLFFEIAGDTLGQGNVYESKGDIYIRIGENSKAFKMYDYALSFFKKAGDPIGQGNVYSSKGRIYLYTGDNPKAIEMYDKALPLFEKVGVPLGQGNVYESKGEIYFYTGDNSRALEMYDKALFFFEKVGEPISQGNLYQSKGDIYFRTGNNLRALKMYNKAIPFFEKAGAPLGQGIVYLSKGRIYSYIGDNSKAIEMYNKALPFFGKIGDPFGQGNVYKEKGNIYFYIGENLKALEMYNKALPFYEKVGEPRGQGNVYLRKGKIFFNTGDISKALKMYVKAQFFFKKTGDPLAQGLVYHRKGEIYFHNGWNSGALEMYDNALLFLEKAGAIQSWSYVLHDKAKVLAKKRKKGEAVALFEKGIASLEKVRTQTAFSEMKKTFMESVYEKYEEAVIFMLDNKYYDKGFKYAEAMRARVFLDHMGEGLVPLEKGLKLELREERDRLVAKLSIISKKMHETGANEEKKLAELKDKYRKTRDEFEDLLIKIRLDNPLYASIRYPEPISVQSLQKEVLKKGEILVRYFITSDKVYVFLVSKKGFMVVPLAIKGEKIKSYVNRWLLAMRENSKEDMKMYGKLLYRELFKPIESKLKGSRDIIIVPDSYLEKIPFESFIMGEAKSGRPLYLLEKYRIKYIQSATLLSVLRKYYQRNRETNNFIGFGDPVYDYQNFRQGQPEQGSMKTFATESTEVTESTFSREDARSDTKEKRLSSVPSVSSVAIENEIKEIFRSRYARVGGLMNRLQGSGDEVRTIARLFESKSQKSLIYLREQATEDNAKAANLKEFDYIHFACHGILEDEFQCLAMSQLPKAQSSEDGYFTMNEIMNCDYNAKLVVLSGCKTGSGKMYKGEGVTGLTRAVMYAGTPAVVSSLWYVDDPATKELMIAFYRNMLEKNMNKTEALRQAKLELLKSEKYFSPLFWSAFVMYGE